MIPLAITRRARRTLAAGVGALVAASVLSACGSSGGTPTLNWYINPDNGAQADLAKECAAASHGKYKITTHILPNDASQQRQQLVVRLAAQDSTIDLMSLDPVFVAEFAEAGFLADVPGKYTDDFTANTVKPAVDAARWKGKLVSAPFWANTQLLWYRPSVVKKYDQSSGKNLLGQLQKGNTGNYTWDEIIAAAKATKKTVGVQADLYEGYTVWINALITGAGGEIVKNPGAIAKNLKLGLDSPAGRTAARIIQKLAAQKVGGPALSTNEEAQSLALFEDPATSGFMTIWPYVWAAMKTDKVKFRDTDVAWTYYPQSVAGKKSRPPFGGIDLGIGKASTHQDLAFQAAQCIRSEKHQLEYMVKSGNPAANTQVYTDNTPVTVVDPATGKKSRHTVQGDFPKGLAGFIRNSLEQAAPRPQSQYYGDLSQALDEQFSPPQSVNQSTPKKAQTFILQVLKGEKLL